ncbi:MAG: glycosyltransferase family 4 protein [Cylindrospermopsis raciborskii PAMP2012]|nr:glycosyltransferase family 4 protein [Cylindrospermopsis raciborskii PAMP2012]
MTYFILTLLSFFLSFSLVYIIKNQLRSHLLDIPNERSSHSHPTPRGGGLGFVISFLITSTAYTWNLAPDLSTKTDINLNHLWLSVLPLAFVSLLDDHNHIPAWLRYIVQVISASLVVSFFGIFPQPWLTNLGPIGITIAILLTLLAMTALINFYNFMDGLDGLVAGITIIQLGFIALMGNQPIWFLMIGAIIGFLWWNWSPAKIFMGDVGSTFLGALVAIALLNYAHNYSVTQSWSALTITLPIVGDTTYTLICRMRRRENIFQSHRTHLYQRLQKSGWSHSQVTISYMIFTSAIALNLYLFGNIGAWINLIITLLAIIILEVYFKQLVPNSSQYLTKQSRADDYSNL